MRPGVVEPGARGDRGFACLVSNQREGDPPVLCCPCTPESTVTVLTSCEDAKCWRCGAMACPNCVANFEAWKATRTQRRPS